MDVATNRLDKLASFDHIPSIPKEAFKEFLLGCGQSQAIPVGIGKDPSAFLKRPLWNRIIFRIPLAFLQSECDSFYHGRKIIYRNGFDKIDINPLLKGLQARINPAFRGSNDNPNRRTCS